MGCDYLYESHLGDYYIISIHAPVWGATQIWRHQYECLSYFNPRTRMGCDYQVHFLSLGNNLFQSTHPYGVRRVKNDNCLKSILFQSTHPYGVRPRSPAVLEPLLSFQSTHPYGVRRIGAKLQSYCRHISIHAPVWGATVIQLNRRLLFSISIHAPVWGATVSFV